MKIGILTSSRADYGIYFPLLKELKTHISISLEIIAFGTHLSKFHGYTLDSIKKDNYSKIHQISSLLSNDDEESIATSYGLTVLKFSEFWSSNSYDLVFCLGDRFEMSAAVQAGIPFQVNFAHIHGGEITLGAIDNIYRHQISLVSNYHFVTAQAHKEKLIEITGSSENIFNVGSLSLNDIKSFVAFSKEEFLGRFKIPLADYILVTFHPETVSVDQNFSFAEEMRKALAEISEYINVVITMPNADTLGSLYRQKLEQLKSEIPDKITLIETLGKQNYFNAIHYSKLLLGNTSSGIIEAASFKKHFVNVGDRQKGRLQSGNVFNVQFDNKEISNKVKMVLKMNPYRGDNIYFKENAALQIKNILLKNK